MLWLRLVYLSTSDCLCFSDSLINVISCAGYFLKIRSRFGHFSSHAFLCVHVLNTQLWLCLRFCFAGSVMSIAMHFRICNCIQILIQLSISLDGFRLADLFVTVAVASFPQVSAPLHVLSVHLTCNFIFGILFFVDSSRDRGSHSQQHRT